MVTDEEKKHSFHTLLQPQVIKFIEKNLNEKSADLAIQRSNNERFPPIVYTQLKNLQRAKHKLPTYFSHRAILPTRAFEQCSSERSAALKDVAGASFLDLTCGLGVDSLFLSKKFSRGVALEANLELAAISQHNFRKMGIDHVVIHHQSAEAFLEKEADRQFDLIYADPDRRDSRGQRQILPQYLQPNIIDLLPQIRKMSPRLLLKMSPLYDLKAAWNDFGKEVWRLVVVSIDNECKEVWVDMKLGQEHESPLVEIKCLRKQAYRHFSFTDKAEKARPVADSWEAFSSQFPQVKYILEPDVAFYKSRKTLSLFEEMKPALQGAMNHPSGYFFSEKRPEADFPGRVFEIVEHFPFQPKKLKRSLSSRQFNVSKRFAPLSVKEIRKRMGIREGGTDFLLCTQWGRQIYVFLAKPLSIYL